MAKNDLRWRRTERNVMAAFGTMLDERPIDKIAVTELARRADINKATFYLHYRDVYDLAGAYARHKADEAIDGMAYLEDFFDDPRAFVSNIVADINGEREKRVMKALIENGLMPVFMDRFTDRMGQRLSELHPMKGDRREEIMLTFLINGLFASIARFADTDPDELTQTAYHLLAGIQEYGERHFGPLR